MDSIDQPISVYNAKQGKPLGSGIVVGVLEYRLLYILESFHSLSSGQTREQCW